MMKMFESLKLGESCPLNHFAAYTGLKIDEMHLAVEVSMCNTDKYMILENINQMIEEAKNQQYFFQTATGGKIDPKVAVLKLEDLRRWFITEYCYDIMENCNKVIELHRTLSEKDKEIKELKAVHKKEIDEVVADKEALKADLEALKKYDDEWGSRVTYDNMVEQIAACEDTKERDEARKLIEPLLKRSTVARFRRDIRNRAKELNGEGANITIQNVAGDFAVHKTVNQIGE